MSGQHHAGHRVQTGGAELVVDMRFDGDCDGGGIHYSMLGMFRETGRDSSHTSYAGVYCWAALCTTPQ